MKYLIAIVALAVLMVFILLGAGVFDGESQGASDLLSQGNPHSNEVEDTPVAAEPDPLPMVERKEVELPPESVADESAPDFSGLNVEQILQRVLETGTEDEESNTLEYLKEEVARRSKLPKSAIYEELLALFIKEMGKDYFERPGPGARASAIELLAHGPQEALNSVAIQHLMDAWVNIDALDRERKLAYKEGVKLKAITTYEHKALQQRGDVLVVDAAMVALLFEIAKTNHEAGREALLPSHVESWVLYPLASSSMTRQSHFPEVWLSDLVRLLRIYDMLALIEPLRDQLLEVTRSDRFRLQLAKAFAEPGESFSAEIGVLASSELSNSALVSMIEVLITERGFRNEHVAAVIQELRKARAKHETLWIFDWQSFESFLFKQLRKQGMNGAYEIWPIISKEVIEHHEDAQMAKALLGTASNWFLVWGTSIEKAIEVDPMPTVRRRMKAELWPKSLLEGSGVPQELYHSAEFASLLVEASNSLEEALRLLTLQMENIGKRSKIQSDAENEMETLRKRVSSFASDYSLVVLRIVSAYHKEIRSGEQQVSLIRYAETLFTSFPKNLDEMTSNLDAPATFAIFGNMIKIMELQHYPALSLESRKELNQWLNSETMNSYCGKDHSDSKKLAKLRSELIVQLFDAGYLAK